MFVLNRFQRFLYSTATKTVRNGSWSIPICYHRAEAAVLMRSLRVPSALPLKVKITSASCNFKPTNYRITTLLAAVSFIN
jgi:hypothetical protein